MHLRLYILLHVCTNGCKNWWVGMYTCILQALTLNNIPYALKITMKWKWPSQQIPLAGLTGSQHRMK